MQLESWQWIVGAVGMAMLELVIPALVLIWFSLGALFVALVVLIYPPPALKWQLAVWLFASVSMVYWWFKVRRSKGKDDQT